MSRNYGLGSRDMSSAGRICLDRAALARQISFATAATVGERFGRFVGYAQSRDVGRMELITREFVVGYGQHLAERVADGALSVSYAHNLVSAVNTVMELATHGRWQAISPVNDCGIEKRSHIRRTPPSGLDREVLEKALHALRAAGLDRGAAIAELARDLGLRSREGALLDAQAALRWTDGHEYLVIAAGTKGGRPRQIPLSNRERQFKVLERAAAVQGSHHSLVPKELTWKEFREGEVRQARELLKRYGITRLHELRAAYACERYALLSGCLAPVLGGKADREVDVQARMQVAEELGHGRIDVTNAYLGGRRS